jgi:hypothetical protein
MQPIAGVETLNQAAATLAAALGISQYSRNKPILMVF